MEDRNKHPEAGPGQGSTQTNWESVDEEISSSRNNVDNNENALTKGTESQAPQPGIATVGNTGAESSD